MKLVTTGYVPLTMTLTVIAEDYETRSDISAVGFQGLTTLDGNGNPQTVTVPISSLDPRLALILALAA